MNIIDLLCFNTTFKHCFWAISWQPVCIGEGNQSARRKPQTFDRKTNNPSQLKLEEYIYKYKTTISIAKHQNYKSFLYIRFLGTLLKI